jgi:hypothetical protein
MSNNKDIKKKTTEQDELVPAEINPEETESVSSAHEANISDLDQDQGDAVQDEASDSGTDAEMSPDDLLEEVRRSLITETVEKEEAEQSKWWKRIGKGPRRKETDTLPGPVSIPDEPLMMDTGKQDDGQGEYVEQLDELIDMLKDDIHEDVIQEKPVILDHGEEAGIEKEQDVQVVDVDELKKRAFQSRSIPEEEERSLTEVRSVALSDGEEVFVEVEAKAVDPRQDRMKAIENALMPYRRYFYALFVVVSLFMVALVSASLYRLYQRSLPPPPTEAPVLLPYPVGMNLPGGLNFQLGKGKLQDGRWNPRGPEWLEGTEVCRWIAIPHSRQLEAVVRTLTREDQIQLIMSNNDTLVYNVSAIDQLTIEEMQALDSNTPCMLLVLAQSGTDERWVITAIP